MKNQALADQCSWFQMELLDAVRYFSIELKHASYNGLFYFGSSHAPMIETLLRVSVCHVLFFLEQEIMI